MIPSGASKTTKADLHCHSTASAQAKLGVQRALGLPECATPPEEVYELAKRRGMDLVTSPTCSSSARARTPTAR